MTILETPRLRLRKLCPDDLENLFEILSDPETMQFYPRPYCKEEVKGWLDKSLYNYENQKYGLWAVEIRETGTFIGQCGITSQNIDNEIVQEIGYHIHKSQWRKGFGTEAARGCLHYGFTTLKLSEIFIHTWIKNIPSIGIAEKLGMSKRKEYDKHIKSNDSIMRHVVYSMLKEDYQFQ
jgi:RimJ/RimL family protein N-acetyltransferase